MIIINSIICALTNQRLYIEAYVGGYQKMNVFSGFLAFRIIA